MHALAVASRPGTQNCTVSYHERQLDHFRFSEQRTFKQRVFSYDKWWSEPSGPILFYCGNEANVELYVNATGLMWENAAQLGALLVFAEHRYYGETQPLGPASAANASTLQWLTMEQALADYASLIHELKTTLDAPDAPVIAVGGSYGGMLAAWLRMHYPAAVVGAIAGSAPVLAFDGLLGGSRRRAKPPSRLRALSPSRRRAQAAARAWDDNSYWRVVTRDATPAAGSAAGCVGGVRASWRALFALGKTAEGRAWLGEAFGLCGGSPLADGADVGRLAGWLLNVWDTLAMGNFPYASNYLVFQQTRDPTITLPPWPFRVACSSFEGATPKDDGKALLRRMAAAAGVLYNASRAEACYDLPADVNYDGIWDYQWCTERLPQETYFSLSGEHDMFWPRPSNRSAVAEKCMRKYGVAAKGSWVAASSGFGPASGASNIVFSNGEYDPWRSGGVLTNLSSTLIAVDIAQGAHHLDLMFSDPADPASVRQARQVELEAMRGWIAEADASGANE